MKKPLSESDPTSREAGSCREAGEESLAKQPLPLGNQVEQLPGVGKHLPTLRTAELLRCHGAEETVAGGGGVPLLDLLTPLGQRDGLHSHPGQHAPDRTVVQGAFFHDRRPWRRLVADCPLPRAGRLAVGLPVVLHVAAGKTQKGRARVALIGKYESRDNR